MSLADQLQYFDFVEAEAWAIEAMVSNYYLLAFR